MVEQIVRLSAKLYALCLRPRQAEVLQQSRINVPVRLRSKNVSTTSITVTWILSNTCSSVEIVNRIWVRKELDLAIGRVVNRGSQNTQVSGEHSGNSVCSVEDECSWPRSAGQTEWQSATCGQDAGEFPAADDAVHPARRIAANHASATKRQFPDSVYIQQMSNVEIRISAADAKVSRIANETTRGRRVGNGRLVID